MLKIWKVVVIFKQVIQSLGVYMKKFILAVAMLGLASMFVACSDDSSSPTSSNGGDGGNKSGKACLNTFTDGEIRCFTHESVEFLCGGTSSTLESSVLVDACPSGYTMECPDVVGDGVTYFYREDMTDCHKF